MITCFLLLFCACSTKNETPFDDGMGMIDLTMDLKKMGYSNSFFISRKEDLKKLGWSFDSGILSRKIRIPHFYPSENQKSIENKLKLMNRQTKEELDVDFYNGVYSISIEDFFSSMDNFCCGTPLRNSVVVDFESDDSEGTPRCIDYNGPLGNGKNDQEKLQSIINFIGSDCDRAMAQGLCLDEHRNGKGGCYNTHGGKICSELINK